MAKMVHIEQTTTTTTATRADDGWMEKLEEKKQKNGTVCNAGLAASQVMAVLVVVAVLFEIS